jgi:pimeloyl-ACP methyl ester carboxylesterase
VAPDQRGYSPGARPVQIDAYATERLVGDALAMMDTLGYARAHVVGHDWGGQLAWLLAARTPTVAVPTLYVWGDADATVGRAAAEGTAAYVTGAYRFVVLPGVGHFVTDQAGERVSELLLEHLASGSVDSG